MAPNGYCRTGEVNWINAGRLGNGLDPLAQAGAILQEENEQLLAEPPGTQLPPRHAETPYCPHKNLISLIGLMRFLAGAITVS